MPSRTITLVAAVAENGVIGHAGGIPWHLPADFAHFKAVTLGHTLIMGRATYDSIGRPLPGRDTIVVTRDAAWTAGEYADRVRVAHSVDDALRLAATLDGDIVVAGGAQVYEQAMPLATRQILTEVHRSPEGDTFYPAFDRQEWVETRRDAGDDFDLVWLERTAVHTAR
ncbi:MAG: dihydrofolate reductase [Nocardioides sp.]